MSDMLGLEGKVAWVLGGGFGMGEATAHRLAEAGCALVIVDRDAERAERVAADVRAQGGRAIATSADVTDEAQMQASLDAGTRTFGQVDLMATVVGIGHWGPLTELSLEEWDYQHRINLTSFFLPARLLARALIADKRPGAIVGVTSISGLTTAPSHAAYGAAKAGMANLVRSMTAEWAPHGIRVNAVAPGSIATPRFQHDPEVLEMMESKLPMGRLGTTDDIAKSITFLLSDLASYVSGHTLLVDGGWSSAYLLDMSFRDRK